MTKPFFWGGRWWTTREAAGSGQGKAGKWDAGAETLLRVFFALLGAVIVAISVLGTLDTYYLRTKGVKTQAEVLEIVAEQRYRVTPGLTSTSPAWRFHEGYYKVKVQFTDQSGAKQERWTEMENAEKKLRGVEAGSRVPFIYVPNDVRCGISGSAEGWLYCILWDVVCIPLGCFMLIKSIFKK